MRAVNLRTEYLTRPLGLENPNPRFYWQAQGDLKQTAYRIRAVRDGEEIWDTGKVSSDRMTHIPYGGRSLNSRDIVTYTVKLWNEKDEAGEETESCFEMGLLQESHFMAKWISGNYTPKKGVRYPVDCFRKEISVNKKKAVKRARLYASARGVYDVTINGARIETFILAPGMTDYRKRIQYQTYDVTEYFSDMQTEKDHNFMIELRLADGWFRGSVAAYGVTNVFGNVTSIFAQLEITYEDGFIERIVTDDTWDWSNDGPICFADLKDGEIYDASKVPAYGGKAKTVAPPKFALTASDNVSVTEHERLKGKFVENKQGRKVLDFGQNIAGYVEFKVNGKAGKKMKLRFGEVLDKEKHVDLSGVQETIPAKGWNQMRLVSKLLGKPVKGEQTVTPKQEIQFTASGGEDYYKTSFSVFGFRYVEIETEIEVKEEDFTAIAVYSGLEQTGDFKCSDVGVNKLVENTRWSMKGNFLDIPTDCPTRERLGWTGDAQIFFNTGAYLMDTAAFFRKWLKDCADDQYANGLLSAVVPFQGVEMMYKATGSSAGWADAIYLIPYRYYKMYGDKKLLQDTWPMIRKYSDYLLRNLGMKDKKQAKENPYNEYTYEKGVHLGEWLEPEEFRNAVYGAKAKHPEECTAYLYLAMTVIGEIAELMGDIEYAKKLSEYAEGAGNAYQELFVKTGQLDTDRQAKLVRSLALGLLEHDKTAHKRALERLKQAVENYKYRVGTGFLSTPFLLPVLSENGYSETAYKMLLNTEKPGWLAEILDGATTVWENWEGNLSQNHYSPGAVCEGLFGNAAGIRVTGENRFTVKPTPGKELKFVKAYYQSIYGKIESSWEWTEDGKLTVTVTVPANTEADVLLPDGRRFVAGAGTHTYIL